MTKSYVHKYSMTKPMADSMTGLHGIIFTGWLRPSLQIIPQAGAYRMRTFLEQNGYNIEVINHLDDWHLAEIMEILELHYTEDMIFVGFSLSFYRYLKDGLLRMIKLRWPHLKLILGGQEVVTPVVKDGRFADKAILGYSETALLHYLDFLSGKRSDDLDWIEDEEHGVPYVIADKQHPYTNTAALDIIWKKDDPFIKRALPIETSRGCVFKCLFCSYPLIGKKKMDYMRSIDNMADEIKRNYEMFGTQTYAFMDDTINESVSKLEHINKAIKKSGVKIRFSCYLRIDLVASFPEMVDLMIDMGLIGAFVGLESMDETVRKNIGKGLPNQKLLGAIDAFRSRGERLWFHCGLIAGLPGETLESIKKTEQWMQDQKHRYFDKWTWNALFIGRHHRWLQSEFDTNYAKYGYRFLDDDPLNNRWVSDTMTFLDAKEISEAMNQENRIQDRCGIDSWLICDLINYGMTVEQISNMSLRDAVSLMNQKRPNIVTNYKVGMRKKARLISSI